MSQSYTANCFQSDHVAQINLQNVENNHECHRSFFSGASAPSNAIPGHPWFDTTNALPRIRNNDNDTWIAILTGTTDQKIWIYRNDSDDGWTIDATVSDRVLAVKGGSGLYNVGGGSLAGETWANLKAHTHTGPSHDHGIGEHNHLVFDYQFPVPNETKVRNQNGIEASMTVGYNAWPGTGGFVAAIGPSDSGSGYTKMANDCYTGGISTGQMGDGDTDAAGTGNTGAQSTSDVRPQACVGTLQYPDI